jgi:hypothetical protein
MGTLLGNLEGAPLPGTLRERLIFRGWGVEGSADGSLRRGTWGGGPFTGNCERSWERAPEMEYLSLRKLC